MSKKSKKLSLRRESLRNLSAENLAQVGGGTYYDATLELVARRIPQPVTGGCTTMGCALQMNFYRYNDLYW